MFALAALSFAACSSDPHYGVAEQSALSTLPSNLNLALNSKTNVTIGALTSITGDVGSTSLGGEVIFDVSSTQAFFSNALANTVEVRVGASVGEVYGNDLLIEGNASDLHVGLDPSKLPPLPAATTAAPGTLNVSVPANRVKQMCAGQYGVLSVGANATLNLNGGIYHVTRLVLADGAKLEPSEPVVIVVGGNVTAGAGASIRPFSALANPMTAADIRIEVGGAVTLGEGSQVRAHLLVPNGRFTTARGATLLGAAWANNIVIGPVNVIEGDGTFSASTPATPPACNDNNACTADACIGGGTASGFCSSAPVPSGTSCDDGNICNGDAICDGAANCQFGAPPAAGTSCADGDVCNGDETCDGFADCQAGAPPVVDDGNECTADACDAETGVDHEPLPDGTSCRGAGTCEGGECSSQTVTFSQQFFSGQDSLAQCEAWNSFRGQLTATRFARVTMSGTFDPFGVTCDDPATATQICQALRDATPLSVFCNGRNWRVGSCGSEIAELSADGTICSCNFGSGYDVRPCIGQFNPNWGGMNTETCSGPSQIMNVTCE